MRKTSSFSQKNSPKNAINKKIQTSPSQRLFFQKFLIKPFISKKFLFRVTFHLPNIRKKPIQK